MLFLRVCVCVCVCVCVRVRVRVGVGVGVGRWGAGGSRFGIACRHGVGGNSHTHNKVRSVIHTVLLSDVRCQAHNKNTEHSRFM